MTVSSSATSLTSVEKQDAQNHAVLERGQDLTEQTKEADLAASAAAQAPLADPEEAGQPGLPPSAFDPRQAPDGGAQAWICVAGSSFVLFCSFGWINTVGGSWPFSLAPHPEWMYRATATH